MSAPFDIESALVAATLLGRVVAARAFQWRDGLRESEDGIDPVAFQAAFEQSYAQLLASSYENVIIAGGSDDQAFEVVKATNDALTAAIGGPLQ